MSDPAAPAVRIDAEPAVSGLTWLATDNHNIGQLAISANTLTVTRRKTDPFGSPRGVDPTWPNTRGFVNGIRDNTGLTHLGAREYEPTSGRFISDDSVTDFSSPQQMNGYAYADNNPVTMSDPSGRLRGPSPGDAVASIAADKKKPSLQASTRGCCSAR
ncbi:RHS repeat-associated core domain-containing protein [Dactylosporangium roseum]|uniref:RHS repeat-associated core domain-containing protein n=1 Tax=Dactylosporangium roseum TaxID=47989 RepID=A0ABY5ZGT7_9ACTN|nr:RHS repeat-associated core domain-containing protein [Dactylosporangium roseum]UWZ39479.1 RHS repeat-associated core domain-containing protein [Dactylosporangium roseum]